MGTVSAVRSYAPFGPDQTRAMGLAFDVAWHLLEEKSWIAQDPVDETRALLGRRIFELAQRGESNPDRLAHYAIAVMRIG